MVDKHFPVRPGQEDEPELDLHDIWQSLVRNRWLVAGVTAATIALAALVTWRQTPVYQSGAMLLIENDDRGNEIFGNLAQIYGSGRGKIETEMIVLGSRTLAEDVVDSLNLTLRVTEPAADRGSVLRALALPADAPSGAFQLTHAGQGVYKVAAEDAKTQPRVDLPGEVRVGVPFRLGSAELVIDPALADQPPPGIAFTLLDSRSAVAVLRGTLKIGRPDPTAHVITISYSDPDPELAAAVPNAVAQTFLHYKSQANKLETRSTVDFLREQVASYERELRLAEDRLRGFREDEQVVSLTHEAASQVQRLATLQAERDRLRSSRESLASLLTEVTRTRRSADDTSPYRQLASFPIFLSNQAVQDMLRSLTTLENQRAELLVRRTSENLDVQGIEQRIGDIERQLYGLARNYLASLDKEIDSTETLLARFGSELQTIPSREVEFARLQREQELLAEMYTLLQTRLKEAEIREAVVPGDVRIVDPALVPTSPVSPKPVRNLTLGAVLGLFLGIGLAFLRKSLDTKVRSREDAEAATAGAPVLGQIPRIRAGAGVVHANGASNGNGKKIRVPGGITRVSLQALASDRLVTRLDPMSPASEAYRTLRTNLTFASAERTPQAIVVTSAMPGDGKSTSASNLAITLAQQGTRTLLVDADLRRGVLHELFDVPSEPGLTHVLMGRATIEQAVVETEVGGDHLPLDFLPAGVFPPNPAELLGSQRMRDLLRDLRERYEVVIFDAPPLNLVTDAAVLGTISDATVLVARVGTTDKRALQHAADQIFHLGAPVSGIVLNDVQAGTGAYGYGYGYGATYGYGRATQKN